MVIAAAMARAGLCGDAKELWSSKVQPLFDVNCTKCHGPLEQKNGLELDTPEMVLKGGDDGKVINPGKPEESLLFQYLDPKSDPHMPPKKQLRDAEIAAVREWIVALSKGQDDSSTKVPVRQYSTIPEAVEGYIAEGWSKRGVKPAERLEDR